MSSIAKHTSASTLDLTKVFAVLRPDMSFVEEAVRPGLYDDLDKRYDDFRQHALVACYDFASSWDTWEKHPAGDELVVLISGKATMVLWRDDVGEGHEESVELSAAGEYAIISQGLWHTARVSEPTKLMFITPGEKTEHGDAPPAGS